MFLGKFDQQFIEILLQALDAWSIGKTATSLSPLSCCCKASWICRCRELRRFSAWASSSRTAGKIGGRLLHASIVSLAFRRHQTDILELEFLKPVFRFAQPGFVFADLLSRKRWAASVSCRVSPSRFSSKHRHHCLNHFFGQLRIAILKAMLYRFGFSLTGSRPPD